MKAFNAVAPECSYPGPRQFNGSFRLSDAVPDKRFPGRRIASFLIMLALSLLNSSISIAQVTLGIDALEEGNYAELQGRRVALITNQTGQDRDGDMTVDLLSHAPRVKLMCILSPEHGFRGVAEHGQTVEDEIDPQTGVKIYSLYGATSRPTDKMLKGVDTIVFDIQDIGTRFYTYITTMGMAIEEAGKRHIRFIVLDRPNPIRGDMIEGDVLDSDIKRMTGYYEIPTRHGLTVGEIALWMNDTRKLGANVRVIKMKKWTRSQWYDQTGLKFIPPSPNIPSLAAALLYSGVGCFEATNVAVGRGTDTPFEVLGAPWMNGNALSAYLRGLDFPGLLFEPVEFTPEKDIYKGERCEGVRMILTDRNKVQPYKLFVRVFLYLHVNYPKDFKPEWEEVRVVSGSNKLREAAEGRISAEEFFAYIEQTLARFREQISRYYLY